MKGPRSTGKRAEGVRNAAIKKNIIGFKQLRYDLFVIICVSHIRYIMPQFK